jgi:peroxiredoxin
MPAKLAYAPLILLLLCSSLAELQPAQADDQAKKHRQTLTKVESTPVAPAFRLEDMDGKFVSLKDYSGKIVIIKFWATWCPPCRFEMPSMQRAYQKLGEDDIEILAVNVGENSDAIFTFTADYPVEFPLIMDRTSEITMAYGVAGIPATFIVSPQGKIIYKAIGERKWDDPAIIEKIRQIRQEQ